jgi:hypothetical protein
MRDIELTYENYFRLRLDSIKLHMLESGGVKNWEGYSESLYPDTPDAKTIDDYEEALREYIFPDA